MKGLFIAYEGPDGCGKSSQLWKAVKYLADKSKYNHVVVTREPYKNTDIRKILQAESDPYSKALELAKKFVEDRKNHVDEMITYNLNIGAHIISDRYILSTLAYQQTQGVPLKALKEMHTGMPIPDLTFIVDVPAEVAIERMKKDTIRKTEQKFEKDIEFIKKLRENYLKLKDELKDYNICIIDGTKGIDEIFEKQIKPRIDKLWAKYSENL